MGFTPRHQPPEHVGPAEFKSGIAGADAENLDLVKGEIVGGQGIDYGNHNRIVRPYAPVDEDASALLMLKALQIGGRRRRCPRHFPHRRQVIVPEISMVIGFEYGDLRLRHHEGRDNKPRRGLPKKILPKAALESRIQLLMVELGTESPVPELPGLT